MQRTAWERWDPPQQEGQRHFCQQGGPQRHDGMACISEVLQQRDTGFLGKAGQEDKEGGAALFVGEQLKCLELCLGMGDKPTESLWVRIKEQNNMGDLVVGVCHRPSDYEEQADEAFYNELEVASHSQAMVLIGGLKLPLMSGGVTTQKGMSNPGSSWRALMTTF